MSLGPDIATRGLALALVAADKRSYPGSGTVAFDLVGTNNGTLTNGTAFNNANYGVWEFDGTDDSIDMPSLIGTDLEFLSKAPNTGGLTYSIWSYNESGTSYYLLSTGSQTSSTGIALSYQAGSGFVSLDTGTKEMSMGLSSHWPLNEWVQFTFVKDDLTWYFYKNGVQIGTGDIDGNSSQSDLQSTLRIAGPNNSSCCRFQGQVADLLVYERALTSTEVLRNYNALKNRFGL